MSLLLRGAAVTVLCAVTGGAVQAQSPISPDRPSVSYGTSTVPAGRFQLESGVEVRRAEGGASLVALPFAVVRAGLGPRTDAQALLPTWSRASADGSSQDGFGDLGLGLRHRVADGGSVRVALLGLVSLPTGDEGFSGPTAARGGAALEAGLGRATLFGTGLLALQERSTELAADLEISLGVSGSLGGRTSGFVEGFAQARGRGAADSGGALAGLGWLLAHDLHLDLYGGLDVAGPATFIGGAGLAVRW